MNNNIYYVLAWHGSRVDDGYNLPKYQVGKTLNDLINNVINYRPHIISLFSGFYKVFKAEYDGEIQYRLIEKFDDDFNVKFIKQIKKLISLK